MCSYLYEPRSKYWYDDDEEGGGESSFSWKEILLFPLFVCLALILFPLLHILMLLYLIWIELLEPVVSRLRTKIAPWISPFVQARILGVRPGRLALVAAGLLIIAATIFLISRLPPRAEEVPLSPEPTAIAEAAIAAEPPMPLSTVEILVDDFSLQPYQGDTVYYYNRLEGDRGAINDSLLMWGQGSVKMTLTPGTTWGGVWMSLNHPIREGLAINFSAILPPQIKAVFQSQITGITVQILDGTPGRTLKLEMKDGDELRWKEAVTLGGIHEVAFDLPALDEINHLVFLLDQAAPGDYVTIDGVTFSASNPIEDTATVAFVWSYGMLLNNWNADSGLVRDKAKDASGEFDAVQASGSLAAATALAEQLGVVEREDAIAIVSKIGEALLNDLPRYHGLWPHWVKVGSDEEFAILENTEWSSVDTVIAAIGLLEAQSALGLDTSGVETLLREIDWGGLLTSGGISHGYMYNGELIPYAWDAFGGESWLVELIYAAVSGQVAPLTYPTPPTANGSGFIDELAWLFVPPPQGLDVWGTDWATYRDEAADRHVTYYPMNHPSACLTQSGYFGLSAGEVPVPAMVDKASIYQAFGVGGRFAAPHDGRTLLGEPVVTSHYSAMIAALRPEESLRMWQEMIRQGLFTPLNNIESLMYREGSGCESREMEINQLKGSWNLALQTLGWGNYLANLRRQAPVLWQAAVENPLLAKGYQLLTSSPAPLPTPGGGEVIPMAIRYERECENSDESTVGQMIWRSNASGAQVHGQFGTTPGAPWPAQPGSVTYTNIELSQAGPVTLTLRYSKYSSSSVPIRVYLDDEPTPRAAFTPVDQGDWNSFTWSEAIALGEIESGVHALRLATDGQQYGVVDLDTFVLELRSPVVTAEPAAASIPVSAASAGDLVTWYDFEGDYLQSGVVTDRSGNGWDAQVVGNIGAVDGISAGQGMVFTGDGYLQAQGNPAAGRTSVTFSLWFKTDQPEANYKLASAAWWSGGPGSGWIMATHIPEFWSDDTLGLYLPDIINNENNFPAGEWIHEVVTYDGERIKEYTSGVLINDWATTGVAIGQGQALVVGAWPPYSAYNFQGSLDEFRIYARCLTHEEVLELYNEGR